MAMEVVGRIPADNRVEVFQKPPSTRSCPRSRGDTQSADSANCAESARQEGDARAGDNHWTVEQGWYGMIECREARTGKAVKGYSYTLQGTDVHERISREGPPPCHLAAHGRELERAACPRPARCLGHVFGPTSKNEDHESESASGEEVPGRKQRNRRPARALMCMSYVWAVVRWKM
ncbi:hypothetical protein B0H13DRAFT_1932120, partial [Mycena leptocephala]